MHTMLRKSLFFMITMLFVLVVSACGDKKEEADAQPEDKDNEARADESDSSKSDEEEDGGDEGGSVINLIDEESENIESAGFETVEFDSPHSPKGHYESEASNGVLILSTDDSSSFIDYENGSDVTLNTSNEDMESAAKQGKVSSDDVSENFLFGDTFYFIRYSQEDTRIMEVDVNSGDIEEIAETETSSVMDKKDGILYVGTEDTLYAVDVDKKETIWEVDTDIGDFGYPTLHVMDNTVILEGMDGIAGFSREDGEELFAEDGIYYDGVADGSTFYALLDETDDYSETNLKVIAFDEEGNQKVLIEAPTIDGPYEEYRVTLDMRDGQFYIHFENGMFAYDAKNYELLWTTAAGNIEDRDDTEDDFNYEFFSAYGDDRIYTLTEKYSAVEEGDNFFSIMDAETGDVKAHYSLGGETETVLGPYVDEEKGKAFVYLYNHEKDKGKVYILPME